MVMADKAPLKRAYRCVFAVLRPNDPLIPKGEHSEERWLPTDPSAVAMRDHRVAQKAVLGRQAEVPVLPGFRPIPQVIHPVHPDGRDLLKSAGDQKDDSENIVANWAY